MKELATKLFSQFGTWSHAKRSSRNTSPSWPWKATPIAGRKCLEKTCITCHRAGDSAWGSKDVGPNLATIRAWNPEQVLINILDPNREVAPNYAGYTVETNQGRVIYGLIAEDNPVSLILKRPDSTIETVLRRDIDQISDSATSLMPDGLEVLLSQQGMADLIAFLLAPAKVAHSDRARFSPESSR